MRYILAAFAALISTPASADVFCNAYGCADFPGISRVGIYTRQAIGASVYVGAAGFIAYQLLNTYYVHEVLHRKRTFCDMGPINCDPSKPEILRFYYEENPSQRGPPM